MKEIKIKYDVPELLLNSLKQNAYVFSGFKGYHELKEASTLLITEDGKIKPFNAFKEDVLKIHEAYNVNYLDSEYNFAVSSAQMAAKWNDFEQDGDDYNLQYRTAGDEKVRADHAILNGTTLPASDPFWDEYVPPLDWNCRCTIVQVLKGKYEVSNSKDAIDNGIKATTRENAEGINKAAMFRFNPGKTLTLFPEKHPYFPRGCADCDLKVKLAANIPESELCRACKVILGNLNTFSKIETDLGSVRISSLHGKNEKADNIEIATFMANKYNQEIDLLGIINSHEEKSPDAFNKTLRTYQEYKTNYKGTKNSIDMALKDAVKKNCFYVVIDIKSDISDELLVEAIIPRTLRSHNLQTIHVKKGYQDQIISRKQLLQKDFKIKWE